MPESVWILTELSSEARRLSTEFGIPLNIAQILVNRKIIEPDIAHKFLSGTLDDLHDPYLLAGMKAAVERVKAAISRQEKILIFGDYDVDGILSVVILNKALQTLGGKIDAYV